jgi:tetratricopeptide (TPR) repeat protein
MKKILVVSLLIAAALGSFAQSTNKAKELLKSKKVQEAKTEIDKVLASEKGAKDPEAWFTKAKIYNEIASDSTQKSGATEARNEAFEALKKYTQIDDKKMLSSTMENHKTMIDIYQGYFKTGAAFYNSNNFADAFTNFKKSLEVGSFINEKGVANIKLDTLVTLYTGISAEKLNQKDTAAIYYAKLADAKVSGDNMVEIYKWLADYYRQKKDNATASKYIESGKALYPKDTFWDSFELEVAGESGNRQELLTKYESIVAKDPNNYLYVFNYGVELYKDGYKDTISLRPANSEQMIDKAAANMKKVIELKPDFPQADLVLGQILFNKGVDISKKMKAIKLPASGKMKPEDQKMKDDLKTQMLAKFDEAVPYFEKVEQLLGSKGKLKMEEKSNLKDTYDLLINIYEQKGSKDKVKDYEDKFNNVDKAH